MLVAVIAAIAQLAGVAGSRGARPTRLEFDGVHERWMVQAPDAGRGDLTAAARSLGGGEAKRSSGDDWYEVQLSDEVAASDAEAAFGEAGATAVEPVLPTDLVSTQSGHRTQVESTDPLPSGPLRRRRSPWAWPRAPAPARAPPSGARASPGR